MVVHPGLVGGKAVDVEHNQLVHLAPQSINERADERRAAGRHQQFDLQPAVGQRDPRQVLVILRRQVLGHFRQLGLLRQSSLQDGAAHLLHHVLDYYRLGRGGLIAIHLAHSNSR